MWQKFNFNTKQLGEMFYFKIIRKNSFYWRLLAEIVSRFYPVRWSFVKCISSLLLFLDGKAAELVDDEASSAQGGFSNLFQTNWKIARGRQKERCAHV